MKASDIAKVNQKLNEQETQRALQIALAKSHVEWFERQSMVINRLVELLPHPGIQPGSQEHHEHRLKALCFACFGLAAKYQVPLDKLMDFGKMYYDEARARIDAQTKIETGEEVPHDQGIAAIPAEIETGNPVG